MTTHHARLSPSNVRWPKCPGSVREEAAYPDISGEAAIDGTGSHELLELCLTGDLTPNFYDGKIIGTNHHDKPRGWLVSADRIERVQMCINYINRRREELAKEYPSAKVTVESESKSDVGAMYDRKDWYGTCDVTISVHVGKQLVFLETIDYKDGRGWVAVENNSQLISYLGGKLNKEKHADIIRHPVPLDLPTRMTIVQPKTNPPVRYSDQVAADIYEACDALHEAAKATDALDAPLVAGKHCQWCKHKPNCTAQAEESLEVMTNMTNDVIAQEGSSLFEMMQQVVKGVEDAPSENLAALMDAKPGIDSLFAQVEKEIEARLESGETVNGYEIRPGRSSKKWALDDEEMVEVLRARRLKNADIFPPKLASPAQILKHPELSDTQKKRLEEDYVVTLPSALKLTRVAGHAEVDANTLFNDVAQSKTNAVQSEPQEIPSFM